MTHDYSERMSLMLDGRLSTHERAEFEAHLVACSECRVRWAAFQKVDHVLATAATFVPAPGFANRFVVRLSQRQAFQAQRVKRERVIAWAGVFAAGAAALAFLIIPAMIGIWFGLNAVWEGAPSLFVGFASETARWIVTLLAFGEAGRTILETLMRAGGPILLGYILILALVTAAWASVMKHVSKRLDRVMLPMFTLIV